MPESTPPPTVEYEERVPLGTTRQLREAAQVMGEARSERKTLAARENGKQGGRPLKPLEQLPCTCGPDAAHHTSRCPRGKAVKRREGNT